MRSHLSSMFNYLPSSARMDLISFACLIRTKIVFLHFLFHQRKRLQRKINVHHHWIILSLHLIPPNLVLSDVITPLTLVRVSLYNFVKSLSFECDQKERSRLIRSSPFP